MNASINVISRGEVDPSRWLTITSADRGQAVVRLQDTVHPGMQSSLKSLICPLFVLQDVLRGGHVQIRVEGGYCLFSPQEDLVEICYEGQDDKGPTFCEFQMSEFRDLVESCAREPIGV